MKWLVLGLLLIGFLFVAFSPSTESQIQNLLYKSTCDTPEGYTIGNIDSRFNLSQSDVQADIDQATQIWNNTENKTLFTYDPTAHLTVNFIYDQRQQLDTQIQSLQQQLNTQNTSLQQELQTYYSQVANFKQQLNDLNNQINSWNQKGGAPLDVYNQLVQKQNDLQQQAAALNAKAKELNLSTNGYNTQVNILNQDVNSFNTQLSIKPEEGLYNPNNNTITIYFASNHQELVHTLAHEFGHSLGMQHVSDPQSIMYPYTTQTLIPTNDDITELQYVCRKQNIFILWDMQLQQFIRSKFYKN